MKLDSQALLNDYLFIRIFKLRNQLSADAQGSPSAAVTSAHAHPCQVKVLQRGRSAFLSNAQFELLLEYIV